MSRPLIIDGSQGEGGGQILRTALSLAAIEGRAIRIEKIRAGRPKPGLAAQHVTSVRAVAALCRAEVAGDEIGSRSLDFAPRVAVQAGDYAFDISAARKGGSAGATGLVLQAVLVPLALARGDSRVTLRGGTHVAWSPPFDYLQQVWLPALAKLGIAAELELHRSGWYPAGGGEIHARIFGLGPELKGGLRPIMLPDRGPLEGVTGRAIAANLPFHIAERMAARAAGLLKAEGIDAAIEVEHATEASPAASRPWGRGASPRNRSARRRLEHCWRTSIQERPSNGISRTRSSCRWRSRTGRPAIRPRRSLIICAPMPLSSSASALPKSDL